MKEFENRLIIKVSPYKNGLFPSIPNIEKKGSAFILAAGCNSDIVINERTAVREIRKGKYKKLVEISTLPYMKEIVFQSPSADRSFSFDVYVKAVVQVVDPLVFYENRNIDVDIYFNNLLSLDIRKITKKFKILHCDGLDEELTNKLSAYNTVDEAIGFSYQISAVGAKPGEDSREYEERLGRQSLDAEVKEEARKLSSSYSTDYKKAVMTEVAEGKITETEAIQIIKEYENAEEDKVVERAKSLRKSSLVTDTEARRMVASVFKDKIPFNGSMRQKGIDSGQYDEFYEDYDDDI